MRDSFHNMRGVRESLERALKIVDTVVNAPARHRLMIQSITTNAVSGEAIGVTATAPAAASDDDDGGGGDDDPEPRRSKPTLRAQTHPSVVPPASIGRASELAPAAGILYRLPDVIARCGKSKAGIYADIARGTFPAPLKTGARSVAWRESDLAAWQAGLSQGVGPAPAGTKTGRR